MKKKDDEQEDPNAPEGQGDNTPQDNQPPHWKGGKKPKKGQK